MIQIRSWNFPQASRVGEGYGGGHGGVRLGFLARDLGLHEGPTALRAAVCRWAVRARPGERGGPSQKCVCTALPPCKQGCALVYAVYARRRALRYLGFRELCASGWAAARRPRAGRGRVPRSGVGAASRAARGVRRPPVRRAGQCLPRWCVPGPRAPAPSLPSPLARSQTQIKHFLPLSSYPAGRAARALPLPAPSLPLAVSQSLCSRRRLGGCEAGAPAPRPAMSPPL